jgi:hypothetical protein
MGKTHLATSATDPRPACGKTLEALLFDDDALVYPTSAKHPDILLIDCPECGEIYRGTYYP